jgi:hypothetical protein
MDGRPFRKRLPVGLISGGLIFGGLLVGVGGSVGCRSTVSVTNTAETASQQLLLNTSADAAVCSLDFRPLAGRTCFLETSGLGGQSSGYLPYRIRRQMFTQGARLVDDRENAEVIVEAGLAAYGTDSQKDEVGIADANSIPDIDLCIRETQYGVAKLELFAWEKASGNVIWESPMMRADSYQVIRKVLGTGPYYSGTIRHSANRLRGKRSAAVR